MPLHLNLAAECLDKAYADPFVQSGIDVAGLKKFLKKNATGSSLGVADAKLGNIIKEKLGIPCIYRCSIGRRMLRSSHPIVLCWAPNFFALLLGLQQWRAGAGAEACAARSRAWSGEKLPHA